MPAKITDAPYEAYTLQSIRIPGAQAAFPTKLVQSAAMASVAPPKAVLPTRISWPTLSRMVCLSDAQLASTIYAGRGAHSAFSSPAPWTVDANFLTSWPWRPMMPRMPSVFPPWLVFG